MKSKRKILKKGGRPEVLPKIDDKLYFILFYLKTYPLQEVLAYSFEISQSEANILIHKLSSILTDALAKLDCMPQETWLFRISWDRVSNKNIGLLVGC